MRPTNIKIELLSEGIFGGGDLTNTLIDTEVLRDDLGFPYLKGKTFKGKLREEMEYLCKYLDAENTKGLKEVFYGLLGTEGEYNFNTIKFSDCKVSPGIRQAFKAAVENKDVSIDDISYASTDVRSFTSLKDGISKEGSLRNFRVIKKGLALYSNIQRSRELSLKEKGLLCCALSSLRHLGMMESRGKGEVRCSLIENGEDVTTKYILAFRQEVL